MRSASCSHDTIGGHPVEGGREGRGEGEVGGDIWACAWSDSCVVVRVRGEQHKRPQ